MLPLQQALQLLLLQQGPLQQVLQLRLQGPPLLEPPQQELRLQGSLQLVLRQELLQLPPPAPQRLPLLALQPVQW